MRLIDADKLMPEFAFINEAEHQIYGSGSWSFTAKCMNVVEEAKTIEPRKKGKWIFIHPLQEDDQGAYMCSNCKTGHFDVNPKTWKACPWCMADMREGGEE